MLFYENRLLADDSHVIPHLIFFYKIWIFCAANISLVWHKQTVQTQIRRHRTHRLILFAVFFLNENEKYHPTTLKSEIGWNEMFQTQTADPHTVNAINAFLKKK